MSNILGKSILKKADDLIVQAETIANPITSMIQDLTKSNEKIDLALAEINENQRLLGAKEQDLLAVKASNSSVIVGLSNVFKTQE